MNQKIQKFILLTIGVLAMSLAIGYLVFAWVEPTAPPPGGNVPAPINVGTDTQTKSGGLNIATQTGNFGVGTTTPSAKLHSFTSPVNLAGNQTNLRIDALGSFDASAASRYNYAAYINASPTKSAGSLSLYNYGIYLQAQGGDYSYGIYTSARNASTINRALYTYAYGGGTTYGIFNYSYNTGSGYNYGIYNYVTGVSNTGGNNFGLYSYVSRSATVSGLTVNNFAIYGYAGGSAVAGSTVNNWGLYIGSGNAYFAGNVGIGTTNLNEKLTVEGILSLRELSSSPSTTTDYGKIYVKTDGNLYFKNDAGTEINLSAAAGGGIGGGGTATQVAFFTATTTIGSDSNLYWDNTNKRLGIGTPSPGVKLDIVGDRARLQTTSGTGGPYFVLKHGGEASGREFAVGSSGSANAPGVGKFEIYDSTANASRLVIDANGNVGIGTTTPAYKLDVIGTLRTTATTTFAGNVGIGTTNPSSKLDVVGNIEIDSWDSQLWQGYAGGGYMRRSIGGAHGWSSTTLYINGWNDWSSGVSIGGPGGTSNLAVTGNLNVGGSITNPWGTVMSCKRYGVSDDYRSGYNSISIDASNCNDLPCYFYYVGYYDWPSNYSDRTAGMGFFRYGWNGIYYGDVGSREINTSANNGAEDIMFEVGMYYGFDWLGTCTLTDDYGGSNTLRWRAAASEAHWDFLTCTLIVCKAQ